jgi:hypothetical protein
LETKLPILARNFRTRDLVDDRGTINGNKLILYSEAVIQVRKLVMLVEREDIWNWIIGTEGHKGDTSIMEIPTI